MRGSMWMGAAAAVLGATTLAAGLVLACGPDDCDGSAEERSGDRVATLCAALAGTNAEAEQAIAALAEIGRDAVPAVREVFLGPDRLAAERAVRTLGRIQGQWGATGDGIFWERSFARACERARQEGKLVMLLHLSGHFDEEFC